MSIGEEFDVCVVGPVCRDILLLPGTAPQPNPGGVPVYAVPVYASLGLKVGVVTTLGDADAKELLAPLHRDRVQVRVVPGRTAVLENRYEGPELGERHQRVLDTAEPLLPEHVEVVDARVVHLGPLVPTDLSPATARALARRVPWLALDVQGLVRTTDEAGPDAAALVRTGAILGHVRVVKADLEEARFLTGQRTPGDMARALLEFGPEEAIVTLGEHGAVVARGGDVWAIQPSRGGPVADPTGAGDTFFAAYLARRLIDHAPDLAARFAAAAAGLCVERVGPLSNAAAEIVRRLRLTD